MSILIYGRLSIVQSINMQNPRSHQISNEVTSHIHKELSKLLYPEKKNYGEKVYTSEQSQF